MVQSIREMLLVFYHIRFDKKHPTAKCFAALQIFLIKNVIIYLYNMK